FGSTLATIVLENPPAVPYHTIFGRLGPPSSPSGASVAVVRFIRFSSAEVTTPIAAADPKGTSTSPSASKDRSKYSFPASRVSSTVRGEPLAEAAPPEEGR